MPADQFGCHTAIGLTLRPTSIHLLRAQLTGSVVILILLCQSGGVPCGLRMLLFNWGRLGIGFGWRDGVWSVGCFERLLSHLGNAVGNNL